METTKPHTKKIIINHGILLGILSVLLAVILYITDRVTKQDWTSSLTGFIIIIVAIVMGLNTYKKSNNGFLILSDALKIGIGIALIGGIISVIWTIILMNVIEPTMVDQMMTSQKEQMVEQFPDMTEEQLDQSLIMGRKFTSPLILSAIILITNLFIGFIISLIAGLIMQKKEELY